jgi:DNA-binding MarR family transcriptional regulator
MAAKGTSDNEPCGEAQHDWMVDHRIVRDIACLGSFLHAHGGGRGGMSHVLIRLLEEDGRQDLRGLQDEMGISSAALSEVVGKLESKGLVTKSVCADDARRRSIALTTEGHAEAERLRTQQNEFREDFLGTLDTSEREQLADLLDALLAHRRETDEKRGNANG